MTRISLAHLSMIDAAPLDLIDAAVAGGFAGVGLRIHTQMGLPGGVDLVADAAALREVKRRLAATGVVVPDVEAFVLTPTTDVATFLPALDVAAELGAGNLLCVGGDEDPCRLLDNFRGLCDAAAERRIRVGLEFIPYMAVKTLGAARDLIARSEHANTALLLDVLHLSRSCGRPEDLAGLTPADFAFVQLCDARAARPAYADLPYEARNDRFCPGEGDLWLDRLMPFLPRDRPLSIEAPILAHAALPFAERARRLGDGVRRFLDRHGWN